MGITIHYQGNLEDLDSVVPLEDRLLDVAIALGGEARLWRSCADDNPSRIVQGLLLDVDPGQETLSLLFSPEGFLIPLYEIESAEQGRFTEPPHCFVKTQFGSVVGHAAVVEILAALRDEFLPNLKVSDESGYWDHRDPVKLAEMMELNRQAIEAFAEQLEQHPLSHEAREDPEIVATRIERVAHLVHESFHAAGQRSVKEPSAETSYDWQEEEARWLQIDGENRTRQERMQRRIQEELLNGQSAEQAIEAAMGEEFPERNQQNSSRQETDPEDEINADHDAAFEESEPDQPWLESLPEVNLHDQSDAERHPLLEQATDLMLQFSEHGKDGNAAASQTLVGHAGEVCGGLAQVLPLPPSYDFDDSTRGLAVVQLKRALRGTAFLRGALLSSAGDDAYRKTIGQWLPEVETMQSEIVSLLKEVRPVPAS